MTEVHAGTIPLSEYEEWALKSIQEKVSFTRTETGALQVECEGGKLWLIEGKRVSRVG